MSPEVMRGPVAPDQVLELQAQQIPEEVFVVFNGLIAQNLRDGRAKVLQKDVLAELEEKGMNRSKIFKQHHLDVEDSYRALGWLVTYDRPVYWGGEDFEAYFEFRAPKGKPKLVQQYH